MSLFNLILGAGALYSGYKGAQSADDANKQNSKIAERNFEAEIKSREEALAEARRQYDLGRIDDRELRELQLQIYNTTRADTLADQMYARYVQNRSYQDALRSEQETKQGATDAAGNRVHFVPGRGWVTDLTDSQRALQVDSEAEQQRQLRTGADRNEQVEARAVGRRGDEDILASEARRELGAVRRPDESALRQLLLARGGEQRNRQNDALADSVARSGIRAGGGTNAATMMQMARGATDQSSARQAGIEAQLAAGDLANTQYAQDLDRPTQMYDYFRRMSTTGPGAPNAQFAASSPNVPGSAVQTGGTGAGQVPGSAVSPPNLQPINGSGVAAQALLQGLGTAPQQAYVQPNNAWSDFAGQLANTGLSWMMYNRGQQENDEYDQRFGGNAGNTGTWLR